MSRLHKHGFNFARKDVCSFNSEMPSLNQVSPQKAPEQLCQLLEMDEGSPEFRRIEVTLPFVATLRN